MTLREISRLNGSNKLQYIMLKNVLHSKIMLEICDTFIIMLKNCNNEVFVHINKFLFLLFYSRFHTREIKCVHIIIS